MGKAIGPSNLHRAFLTKMAAQLATHSLHAFAALAEGRPADAVSAWRLSPDIEMLPIAYKAVALNNAALARLISGDRVQSRALLQRAADAGSALCVDVAESAELRGSSSSFHFRLAAKHTSQFTSAANARGQHIASAIAAIIGHHAALVGSRQEWRTEGIVQDLRSACGRSSAEVSLLHARRRSEIAAGYASRLIRLRQALAAPANNERQVSELALAAMGILPPALVGSVSKMADVEMGQTLQ